LTRLSAGVVIVTYNRPEVLETALSLWRLSARVPDQFLVVDASPDAAARRDEVLKFHPQLFGGNSRYLTCSTPSIARQRNVSLEQLQTDLVFYVDDDCRPESHLLQRVVEVFEADAAECVGGVSGWGRRLRTLDYRLARAMSAPFRRHVARFGLSRRQAMPPEIKVPKWLRDRYSLSRVRELRGSAMAFRTRLVKELGGFDSAMEGYSFGEDFDVSYRLGRTHALVRRDDTIIDFSIASGSSVPKAHYFLLGWINPAYLIEKLELGEAARRALMRRLHLSKHLVSLQALGSRSSTPLVGTDLFEVAERMVRFIRTGEPKRLVERFTQLQEFVFSVAEDETRSIVLKERFDHWASHRS
jgi:GT2 family glycosyltransferase